MNESKDLGAIVLSFSLPFLTSHPSILHLSFMFRLVGLLMVTKALPAGDVDTIAAVYDAVGHEFLARLLLPLHSSSSPSDNDGNNNNISKKTTAEQQQAAAAEEEDEEEENKKAGMVALGVAVLSSVAQALPPPTLSSDDFTSLLPLFLKVIRCGGIVVQSKANVSNAKSVIRTDERQKADVGAVDDALMAAVAITASSPLAQRIAEESGALEATTTLLRRSAHADPSKDDFDRQLWALRLVEAVVRGDEGEGGGGDGSDMGPSGIALPTTIANHGGTIQLLIPCLARLIAVPSLLELEQDKRRAVAVHLQALHTALLFLPLPMPEGAPLHATLSRGILQSIWARHMRLGIVCTLQERGTTVQRHSALQLASAMVSLAGPRWLWYSVPGMGTMDRVEKEKEEKLVDKGKFLQVLVEIIKVEIHVLLHDALTPATWRGAVDGSYGGGLESIGEDAELGDVVDDGGWAGGRDGVQSQSKQQGETYATSAATQALELLPHCLILFEGCVEALAQSQEEEEDGDGVEDEEYRTMPMSVAQRAMSSLQEAASVLLEVLEEEEGTSLEGASSPRLQLRFSVLSSLKVAAVRALGRFLAEAPEAFSDRVRRALPRLLSIRSDALPLFASGGGTCYSTATYEDSLFNSFDRDSVVERVRSEDQQEDEVRTMAEGVAFLIPLLLQVTSPAWGAEHPGESKRWMDAIVLDNGLRHVVDYAVACADLRAEAVTQHAAVACDGALLAVSKVLLQIIGQIEAQMKDKWHDISSSTIIRRNKEGDEEDEEDRHRHIEELCFAVADATWPLVTALTEVLTSHEIEELAEAAEEEACMVVRCTALLAAVLETVAEEVDHPDPAHRARIDMFRRGAKGGLGPVSGEDIHKACRVVAKTMKFVRSTLGVGGKPMSSATTPTASVRRLEGEEMEEIKRDYSTLLVCVRRLVACSLVFCAAVEEETESETEKEERVEEEKEDELRTHEHILKALQLHNDGS